MNISGLDKRSSKLLNSKFTYITFIIAFVIMFLLFPNEGKFKYEYQRGRAWRYETLVAPIDFPILKSPTELLLEKDAAANKIVPYYKYDQSISDIQISLLDNLKKTNATPSNIINNIINTVTDVYKKGVLAEKNINSNDDNGQIEYIIIQKELSSSEALENSLYTPEQALRLVKHNLSSEKTKYNIDSIITVLNLADIIIPNLIYNQQATEAAQRKAIDFISPTKGVVYTGELIVSKGEIINAEIEQLLDSYKEEYRLSMGYSQSSFTSIIGKAIFIILILLLFYISIYFVDTETLKTRNRLSFLLSLFLLMYIITAAVIKIDSTFLYMVPFAVFVLYMMAFFPARLVFPIYMISLLPLLVLAESGTELYILNVFAGAVSLVSFTYLNRGWLQFMNSLLIFIGILVGFFAFRLMEDTDIFNLNYSTILYIFLNALFIVAAYPLVFLLEKLFLLVSIATLKDLSDTNNRLLQELARKAPGTFQHSLQVANLTERAVTAIKGNTRLAKVGAMYHDVGKLINPQCFIENEAPGVNYHSQLSPSESAKEIIKHVSDGIELAKKYNLPPVIIEFITSHHAKSQTLYFYTKYCNQGGDPGDKKMFTYNGTYPTSKEQVVVMMADAVEAASRTLKDYSKESISELVDNIIGLKVDNTQLIKADISIKEINIVKSVFKKHLQEIYHARIAYPAKKK